MTTLERADAEAPDTPSARLLARRSWLRFFGLTLPATLAGFALLSQVAAAALHGVQPFRSSLDTIVVAAERAPGQARWLVFGDSLTQHALIDFRLGPADEIANLTTHAGAGLPSVYLLLRRYLATHPAPKAILMAVAPETYAAIPSQEEGRFWLTPVFREPEEQAWLAQFYPSARSGRWLPAAFDLKNSVLDPLTGVLAGRRDRLPTGPDLASPDLAVEAALARSPVEAAAEAARASRHVALGSARAVWTDICRLARAHNVAVHVALVPMPAGLRGIWAGRGELAGLQAKVGAVLAQECGQWAQVDLSSVVQPPNFDDEATHIAGRGWINRYALILSDYIHRADPGLR